MEYLIERADGEWFDLPYASYPDVLHPTTFPWQQVEGWGDHRIRVLGCDIAFSDEPPGLQISFEGTAISRKPADRGTDCPECYSGNGSNGPCGRDHVGLVQACGVATAAGGIG